MEVLRDKMSSPEEYIAHYGVKGMKWGVRRSKEELSGSSGDSNRKSRYESIRNRDLKTITVSTKNGEKVTASQEQNGRISSYLLSLSKRGTANAHNYASFKISAEDGRKVGEGNFQKVSDDEINLVWLGVKSSERGKGYGSAVFDAAVEYGKSQGVKRLTLEVPGNAPDAKHIYEKAGFKVTKAPTKKEIEEDFVWGGLTHMALELDKISHTIDESNDEIEIALIQTFQKLDQTGENLVFEEDELTHYGIKGMKWGVRRSDAELNRAGFGPEATESRRGMSPATKKKIAIGAAAVGVVALGVGVAYAAKSGKLSIGKKTTESLLKNFEKARLKEDKKHRKTVDKLLNKAGDSYKTDDRVRRKVVRKATKSARARDAKLDALRKELNEKAIQIRKDQADQVLAKHQKAYAKQAAKNAAKAEKIFEKHANRQAKIRAEEKVKIEKIVERFKKDAESRSDSDDGEFSKLQVAGMALKTYQDIREDRQKKAEEKAAAEKAAAENVNRRTR